PQDVLAEVYPHALGVFEPTEADEVLAQAEICPKEEHLRPEWESAVAPVLNDAGLEAWPSWRPVYGGRVGRHPAALDELLASFCGFTPADPLRAG
ncbi:MAG: phenylacetate-CoA oxygenase subunit PaaI, partial [Planctomycetes bacterium]|nr:phenylacetate-CoA oxygenase subunit PaaI [Planctomycetota bacterium]